jgi:hypothetical protein
LNLYSYVRNLPTTRLDADGHEPGDRASDIAQEAQNARGSDHWDISNTNVSNGQLFRKGSDKCNEFVADTVTKASGGSPTNVVGTGKIPTASQFADPKVKITGLSEPKPLNEAKPGDVIAQPHGNGANGNPEGHVGIVVAAPTADSPGQTASANANPQYGGQVTINDWGFRKPDATPNNGERNGANSPPPVVRHPLPNPPPPEKPYPPR